MFRGVPELLTLYIVYFGLQLGLQKRWKSVGLTGNIEMPAFVAGMIALGLVLGAFSSEVWIGALNAIHKGQREGAYALGLSQGADLPPRRVRRSCCASPCPASATTGWCF